MINFRCILRRVYIVRDFEEALVGGMPEFFHVSVFKWSRPPADKSMVVRADKE